MMMMRGLLRSLCTQTQKPHAKTSAGSAAAAVGCMGHTALGPRRCIFAWMRNMVAEKGAFWRGAKGWEVDSARRKGNENAPRFHRTKCFVEVITSVSYFLSCLFLVCFGLF